MAELPRPGLFTRVRAAWRGEQDAGALLAADYAEDPGTVGYLPRVTYEQVWSWFGAVEAWLSQARQAASNPDHDLSRELRLPADPAAWVEVEPPARCPDAHLAAML